jgi:hypothetical protein
MAFRMPIAAAPVRLQCPAAAGKFYEGMDAPTAMCRYARTFVLHLVPTHKAVSIFDHATFCSNCFKKRREHTVPPESAIEAENAAAKVAQQQAEMVASAALKAEQQRAAAAATQGKILAEKEAAARASAEAAATALAASRLRSDAEAGVLAVSTAIANVRRDSEVQAMNDKQLQVSERPTESIDLYMYSVLSIPFLFHRIWRF